jgi:hypothetical protein
MNEDCSDRLAALYRAGAADEPDLLLDEAVLEAARRRPLPHPAALATIAVVLLLAVVAHNQPPAPVSAAAPIASAVPPGLDEGRSRIVMMSLSPATERPGMALQPAYYGGTR